MPRIRHSTIPLALLAATALALGGITPAVAGPMGALIQPLVKQEVIKGKGPDKGKKLRLRLIAGKAHTDGFLTPGGTETLTLQHLPKKAPLLVGSGPSPIAGYCGERCRFTELVVSPVPIRTSIHGKAFLSFTMPTGYLRDAETRPGEKRRAPTFVPYENGNIVVFEAITLQFGKRKFTIGSATAEATIQIP